MPPGSGDGVRGGYGSDKGGIGSSTSGPSKIGSSNDGTTSGSNGGNKDGHLCCPKCGNPCIHVETFVCMSITCLTSDLLVIYISFL